MKPSQPKKNIANTIMNLLATIESSGLIPHALVIGTDTERELYVTDNEPLEKGQSIEDKFGIKEVIQFKGEGVYVAVGITQRPCNKLHGR